MGKKIVWGVFGAFVLFMVLGTYLSNQPEAKEKSAARNAIDLCWQEQAKKSNAPATARFIASTCEKMEADFSTKYGERP